MSFLQELLFVVLLRYAYRALKSCLKTPRDPLAYTNALRGAEQWEAMNRAYAKAARKTGLYGRYAFLAKDVLFILLTSAMLRAMHLAAAATPSPPVTPVMGTTECPLCPPPVPSTAALVVRALGAPLAECLDEAVVAEGERCFADRFWAEEVRDAYRQEIRSVREPGAERLFFRDAAGALYYALHTLERRGARRGSAVSLVREVDLLARLDEAAARGGGAACLCPLYLGLLADVAFLRYAAPPGEARWLVMHAPEIQRNGSDARVVQTRVVHPAGSPFHAFAPAAATLVLEHHDTFTVEFCAARAEPSGVDGAVGPAGYEEKTRGLEGVFILRRVGHDRLRLQLSGTDASCFVYCRHLAARG
jgi:hypothetical protein